MDSTHRGQTKLRSDTQLINAEFPIDFKELPCSNRKFDKEVQPAKQ